MTVSIPPSNVRSRVRWSPVQRWLGFIGLLACVQSITITPPVTVKFVDAGSRTPVPGLPVTAVWNLIATNPAGSTPSTILKVRHLQSDQAGEINLGLTVNLRESRFLPALYVVDERYGARRIANDPFDRQRPAPISALSLQRSSIDGTTVHLSRESGDIDMRFLFLSESRRADEFCRQRWLCQED
jgi:hypothetical protein